MTKRLAGLWYSYVSEFLCFHNCLNCSCFIEISKELRSREEELRKAANWQKEQADLLNLRAKELANRELEIVRREVMLLIQNQQANRPVPKKRRNHFVKGRTRLSGKEISTPHGKTFLTSLFS